MSSKFPKTPSDENLQSLAHDLLGVDLNAPADLDEPFDVDGLGLDDLGFGGPSESPAPARSEEPTPPAAAAVESDSGDDPLAWIVKASRNPSKPAETRPRVETPIEIDNWDDDDFGAGILEVPVKSTPVPPAPAAVRETADRSPREQSIEPEDDFGAEFEEVDEIEIEEELSLSVESTDEDESLEFGAEEPEVEEASPRRGRQQITRDAGYWDALEGWNEWEDKPAPAARNEETRDSSDRRGRRSRGDRRPRRDNDSGSGRRSERSERPAQEQAERPTPQRSEAREEAPASNERRGRRDRSAPQAAPQEERPRREPARQEEQSIKEEPRREGRRGSGRSRGRDRNREGANREVAAESRPVEPVADSPAPQKSGRDRAEGRTPAAEEESGRSRRRGSRNDRRGSGHGGREQERPIEEPVQLSQESDDDFGGGIFVEPVQESRNRRRTPPPPAPIVHDDFGDDEEDFIEDEFVAEEVVEDIPAAAEGDDFGAGLELEAPRTRRRPPPSGRRPAPAQSPSGSRRGPRQERPRAESRAESNVETRRSDVDELLPAVDPEKYAGVPTWEHAISLLVKKQPRSSSGPRRGGGGGGRGGDERRRRGNGRGNRNGGGSR